MTASLHGHGSAGLDPPARSTIEASVSVVVRLGDGTPGVPVNFENKACDAFGAAPRRLAQPSGSDLQI